MFFLYTTFSKILNINFNFSCVDVDNFSTFSRILNCTNVPSFFHLNVQRTPNLSKFENFVEHLSSFPLKPELISLVETWFLPSETGEESNCSNPISIFTIPGYKGVFSSRNASVAGQGSRLNRSGGVALFVRDDIPFTVIEKDNGPVSFIQVELTSVRIRSKLFVTSMYMPKLADFSVLLDKLEHLFLNTEGKNHLLLGDLNLDVSLNGSLQRKYLSLLNSYDYTVANNQITRPASSSVIDHVVSNIPNVCIATVGNDISDHNDLIAFLPSSLYCGPSSPESHGVRFGRIVNFERLNDLIAGLDPYYFQSLDPTTSVTELVSSIVSFVDQCTEIKRIRVKNSSCKPWLDNHRLRTLANRKKATLSRLRRHPEDVRILQQLAEISLLVKDLKTKLKREYFEKKMSCSTDCKTKWKEINRVLGRSNAQSTVKRLLRNDRSTVTSDPKLIADELNSYFTGIGPELRSQIPNSGIRQRSRRRRISSSMYLYPTSVHEIYGLLLQLKPFKATGIDAISNKILKACALSLAPILHCIFQKVFETGIYPNVLKLARVVPIFKAGSRDLSENYRPISVLTGINRILESLINERLVSFFSKVGLLFSSQYGFRRRSSTSTAAYEALNFVIRQLDLPEIKVVSGLFLDLSKAFDLVDHELLLSKLYDAGCRGPISDLIASYLNGRCQRVAIGTELSDIGYLTVGVPQGSILGPLFFLVYVNDIASLPLKGQLYLYADDSVLFYPGATKLETITEMNADLLLLCQYFNENLLVLNELKSKYIHFHNKRQNLAPGPEVLLNGKALEEVSRISHLGLILDKHLDWSEHCRSVVKKISSGIGAIFHCRRFLPQHILLQMYHCFVHVHLSYMVGLWGSAASCFLKPVQVAQNRALKLVFGLPRLTPTSELFTNYAKNILPVRALYRYTILRYLKQSLSGDAFGNTCFEFRRCILHLRDDRKLLRPMARTDFGKVRMEFAAPTFFNELSHDIRMTQSTESFCSKVKRHFLSASEIQSYLF